MADTAIAITAGTGTNVDTRTEGTNGNHRQVIVVGDPATNAGVAPVDATAGLKVNLGADNDVTVTGTVDLGATDNAVLDAIEADTTTIAGAVLGTEMQVDVLTMPTTTVTATNLDVRDLAKATDSVTAAVENAHEADFDTGVGTDTTPALGIAVPASGGAAVVTGDATNGLDVDVTRVSGTVTVDGSGVTQPVSGTVTANLSATDNAVLDNIDTDTSTIATNTGNSATSLGIVDDWDNAASDGASVSGDVAHDGADTGEPVKIGMKAVALKANPAEVAAGDRTDWYADVSGIPFVLGGHPNTLTQALEVTDTDGPQTDTAIITAGANVAVVVTKVSVMADNANTADVSVRIGFGTANTPAADQAQTLLFHPGIAPGSGVVEGNGSGIIGIGASNEDVRITCEDPVGGSISVIVTYFTTDI